MKTTGLLLAFTLALAGCAGIDDASDPTVATDSDEVAIRPTFDLWKAGDGWRFNFLASNGETLMTSQAYSTRTAGINGLLSVLDNGGFASRYEIKTAADGQFYFNLLSANLKVDTLRAMITRNGGEVIGEKAPTKSRK